MTVPYGTIRHILRRNKNRIKCQKLFRKHEKREFVDWYSAKPFEIVQIDIKGKSWIKIKELRKLISAFGCRLIQNRKGHPEDNSHLERSHRTDDEEFYIQRVFKIKSERDLLKEALNEMTPFQYLKEQMPNLDDTIKLVPPIMLDQVSTKIGPWGGYNVLAQNLSISALSKKAVRYWYSSFRNHLSSDRVLLEAIIQLDEAYFGGWKGKTLLMAKQKGVRKVAYKILSHLEPSRLDTLVFLREDVKPGSILCTDGFSIYDGIERLYPVKHVIDIHKEWEYSGTSEIVRNVWDTEDFY